MIDDLNQTFLDLAMADAVVHLRQQPPCDAWPRGGVPAQLQDLWTATLGPWFVQGTGATAASALRSALQKHQDFVRQRAVVVPVLVPAGLAEELGL